MKVKLFLSALIWLNSIVPAFASEPLPPLPAVDFINCSTGGVTAWDGEKVNYLCQEGAYDEHRAFRDFRFTYDYAANCLPGSQLNVKFTPDGTKLQFSCTPLPKHERTPTYMSGDAVTYNLGAEPGFKFATSNFMQTKNLNGENSILLIDQQAKLTSYKCFNNSKPCTFDPTKPEYTIADATAAAYFTFSNDNTNPIKAYASDNNLIWQSKLIGTGLPEQFILTTAGEFKIVAQHSQLVWTATPAHQSQPAHAAARATPVAAGLLPW